VGREHCRHSLADLSDYLDGGATAVLCAEIEWHLADCPDCRVLVDTLRQTVSAYRDLPRPGFPAEARERLYRALDLDDFLPPKQ
jgi:predicted anti-sigma-YlaC factor YlaD